MTILAHPLESETLPPEGHESYIFDRGLFSLFLRCRQFLFNASKSKEEEL